MALLTTGEDEKAAGLGVQVIARAASVLRALEGRPDGLSLGQIAKEVGLARSTVQRIVAALAAEDFVAEAQPGHGVRIGPGLARIAASLSSNYGEILHPHLVALRDEVRETVDLSILSGGSAVFIDQIPPPMARRSLPVSARMTPGAWSRRVSLNILSISSSIAQSFFVNLTQSDADI